MSISEINVRQFITLVRDVDSEGCGIYRLLLFIVFIVIMIDSFLRAQFL